MKVTIFGPNLRDQSKGQFHVHAAGCADCKHYGPGTKFGSDAAGMTFDAASRLEVSTDLNADILSDYGLAPGTPEGDEMLLDWLSDLWFAPCLKSLPVADDSAPEPPVAPRGKAIPSAWREANHARGGIRGNQGRCSCGHEFSGASRDDAKAAYRAHVEAEWAADPSAAPQAPVKPAPLVADPSADPAPTVAAGDPVDDLIGFCFVDGSGRLLAVTGPALGGELPGYVDLSDGAGFVTVRSSEQLRHKRMLEQAAQA